MQLQPGTRVGVYEIAGTIGAGGMGEVYRARDTRLGRDVAIKVLPALFAGDAERLARFEREARTLASLNHPHIAQIYGIAESDPAADAGQAVHGLVMELVDGEDLAERLQRGAVPLEEALQIARQVAEALEAAHELGIIHRDLKPANIKVRQDGTVKVLDFGLAKALDPTGGEAADEIAVMNSPTMSLGGTRAGIILGTAAYMAPEQARGQAIDRRVDVWAFGVVLFEMLAGRPAFAGETISDILASVLKNDLDWATLPPGLPAPIVSLLHRCLTPDRKNRLRDIGEARIAIDDYLTHPLPADIPPPRPSPKAGPWRIAAAILAIALGAALVQVWRGGAREERPQDRYLVHPPRGAVISTINRPALSVAPDGRALAFVAIHEGVARLYLQRRDEFEPRLLPGTEGASDPVFSPDGQSIVFSSETRLKLLRLDGAIVPLATVNDPRGATWVDSNTIAYVPEATGGISEISSGGGASRALTTIPVESDERTHRWPHALPGGRHVLFTVGTHSSPDNYDDSRIDAVDRQTGERRTVLPAASMVRYAPTGHLVYARAGTLFAVRFDPLTLSVQGTQVPLMQELGGDTTTGAAHVAWAHDGTMAYIAGGGSSGLRRLVWADRTGQVVPIDVPSSAGGALYNDGRISPDGSRMAVVVGSTGRADIYVYHFERQTFTRLTFTGANQTPVWSGDGRDIYYSLIGPTGRPTTIHRMQADGGIEGSPVASFDARVYLKYISRDGTWGIADRISFLGEKADVVRFTVAAEPELTVLAATRADEYASAVSSDERWVAYQSDENERPEIYVRAADGTGGRWQVSNAGGEEPMWAPDGRALYYRIGTRLMIVPVEAGPAFRTGPPSLLFDGIFNLRSDTGVSYDVHPKGDRFVMVRQVTATTEALSTIRVVLNWFDEVRRLAR